MTSFNLQNYSMRQMYPNPHFTMKLMHAEVNSPKAMLPGPADGPSDFTP